MIFIEKKSKTKEVKQVRVEEEDMAVSFLSRHLLLHITVQRYSLK